MHSWYGRSSVGCVASAKNVCDQRGVILDGHRLVQRQHRSGKDFQVGVVTLVVLGDGAAEPLQVAGAAA